MFIQAKKVFRLMRIGLVRAACPRELEASADNVRLDKAIVIDANERKFGSNAIYTPRTIVVAGAARRRNLLEKGIVHAYAFVSMDAVADIKADDEISSADLMQRLVLALNERILGKNFAALQCSVVESPGIVEVYPFESHFTYTYRGDKYRQGYFIDPVQRKLYLAMSGEKIMDKFIDPSVRHAKPGEMMAGEPERMPMVQTGLRYAVAPVAGNDQTSTRGAANSELVTGVIRNWKNVMEAVAMYLVMVRNGQHKPPAYVPSFAPVHLTPAGKIGQEIGARGVDVYDFAIWSAGRQLSLPVRKVVASGEDLGPGDFAYVADKRDPSTWLLPMHDGSSTRASMKALASVPRECRMVVKRKLEKASLVNC